MIDRELISKKLKHSLEHKLTIITAPAGYGKTTGILKWLEGRDTPVAWLSLDLDDNDPVIFWRYVCAALDNVAPGLCQNTDYVFSSQELFLANTHLSIIIDNITKLDTETLLVLDDFHHITDPAILASITYLIDYMPKKMRLMLIGRKAPVLELTRLGVSEQADTALRQKIFFSCRKKSPCFKNVGELRLTMRKSGKWRRLRTVGGRAGRRILTAFEPHTG